MRKTVVSLWSIPELHVLVESDSSESEICCCQIWADAGGQCADSVGKVPSCQDAQSDNLSSR